MPNTHHEQVGPGAPVNPEFEHVASEVVDFVDAPVDVGQLVVALRVVELMVECMDVTLLYFADCPNWLVAKEHLDALRMEHPEMSITHRVVDTPEEAERTRFRGSPSIQIDGVDPFAEPDAPVGLSCRVYQTPDGPAGSPTLDQLRDVLAQR